MSFSLSSSSFMIIFLVFICMHDGNFMVKGIQYRSSQDMCRVKKEARGALQSLPPLQSSAQQHTATKQQEVRKRSFKEGTGIKWLGNMSSRSRINKLELQTSKCVQNNIKSDLKIEKVNKKYKSGN